MKPWIIAGGAAVAAFAAGYFIGSQGLDPVVTEVMPQPSQTAVTADMPESADSSRTTLPLEPIPTPDPAAAAPSEPEPVPEPLTVTTVSVTHADGPPPMTDATLNAIERFDYAMDREFDRLDRREASAGDAAETETITEIKERLSDLDDLYRRADLATNAQERIEIRKEMQQAMGSIIGLSRRDREERLARLATDIGYTDPDAVQQFVREIDRVYRETHMDWTKLFNRTPPAMGPAGDRSVSPGMEGEEN